MTIKYSLDDKYTLYCDKCNEEISDFPFSKNGNQIFHASRFMSLKQHFHAECYP